MDNEILAAIFKRDDIRGIWPQELTSESAFCAGAAFASFIHDSKSSSLTIAVGYDARVGSADLAQAVCRGISSQGDIPHLLNMVSSEQLYFACGRYPERYDGGVMVTASHNPAEYNGMKFVLSGGAPLGGDDLIKLRELMKKHALPVEKVDLGEEFADFLLEASGADVLRKQEGELPLKVVVAAGNGVGCLAFAPISRRLSATGLFEFVELDGIPDGRFPRGVPNPLLPDYMKRLGEKVRECGAVFGIGFDGDADRAGFVDGDGMEITPPMVYALVAKFKLFSAQALARPLLMRNLCCSRLILDLANGVADVLDTPVGHGQIKRLMRHPKFAERVIFAGEHSGHYFYPEFFSVDSGMMTSLIILQLALQLSRDNSSLAQVLNDWRKKYVWSGEINFTLPSRDDIYPKMQEIWLKAQELCPLLRRQEVELDPELKLYRVFDAAKNYAPQEMKFPDLKGICDNGCSGWWFVVRPSGNEPKLRLNVEAWGNDAAVVCKKYTDELKALFVS